MTKKKIVVTGNRTYLWHSQQGNQNSSLYNSWRKELGIAVSNKWSVIDCSVIYIYGTNIRKVINRQWTNTTIIVWWTDQVDGRILYYVWIFFFDKKWRRWCKEEKPLTINWIRDVWTNVSLYVIMNNQKSWIFN